MVVASVAFVMRNGQWEFCDAVKGKALGWGEIDINYGTEDHQK